MARFAALVLAARLARACASDGSHESLRGIAYGALPLTAPGPAVSEDMVQVGYAPQWGPEGRDDLGMIRQLGGNAVRLYHSLGLPVAADHGTFLDRAAEAGINVMPGYHTYMYYGCPQLDCFGHWRNSTLEGFERGFARDGDWHPVVSTLILMNEPDFINAEWCAPWCRVKAVLSALDGVLSAERDFGIRAARAKLTAAWSFAMATSIDGEVTGPGIFGFQDMVAAVADPSLAHYTPRTPLPELQLAFWGRWVHSLNTQAPWGFVAAMIAPRFERFRPHSWFIGEYGANGQPRAAITEDLRAMHRLAGEGSGFLGACMFQFQTAYFKGSGSELNFGIFSLADQVIGEEKICEGGACQNHSVHCLSTDLPWLPDPANHRAEAVAAAWNGTLAGARNLCPGGRRLEAVAPRRSVRHLGAIALPALAAVTTVAALAGRLGFRAAAPPGLEQALADELVV